MNAGRFIHGLTLSKQQLAHARERYRREGIDDKASASFTDIAIAPEPSIKSYPSKC